MTPRLASIIVPVYNQADHIRPVLDAYAGALAKLPIPWELLVVINGTRRDDSLEICRQAERELPGVQTHCIDEGGWGRAVRYGIAHAKGDLLCYTNCARTSERDLLLLLVYGVMHDDCVIKANRKIRESVVRRFGSLVFNLECRALFDLPFWDINGTPKVFPRRFAKLLELGRDDDLIDLEFNVVCKDEAYPMLEVPILSATRRSGTSTTSWKSAVRMYWGAERFRAHRTAR